MTAVAIKPEAVETAPLAYLKDFDSTGYCMDACCVHLDINGGKEPHAQFECAHGVWRFKEHIYLTREDATDSGWNFNIDGGETQHVQSGCNIDGTLVCGDCGTETVLIDQWYGPLECGGCNTKWARTTRWSSESVPADEISNPLNVIEYRVIRGALEELQWNGFIEFGMWDSELDSDEAKVIGSKYQAVATEDVIAQLEALVDGDDIDGALALWKRLVAEAEANGTLDAALEQLAEREDADEAKRANQARREQEARNVWFLASLAAPPRTPYVGPKPAVRSRVMYLADTESRGTRTEGYGPTVPSVTFSSVSIRPPVARNSAFGRIVEGGAR